MADSEDLSHPRRPPIRPESNEQLRTGGYRRVVAEQDARVILVG